MILSIFFVLISTLFGTQIRLGNQILTVEIANTDAARATGLMGRTELPEGQGMLFVYDTPQFLVFWMKNTRIPLSIGFFDENRSLIRTLDMDPPSGHSLRRYHSESLALYALEVPQGWFQKHKIEEGFKFSFLDPADQVQ